VILARREKIKAKAKVNAGIIGSLTYVTMSKLVGLLRGLEVKLQSNARRALLLGPDDHHDIIGALLVVAGPVGRAPVAHQHPGLVAKVILLGGGATRGPVALEPRAEVRVDGGQALQARRTLDEGQDDRLLTPVGYSADKEDAELNLVRESWGPLPRGLYIYIYIIRGSSLPYALVALALRGTDGQV
jgi:hypothetical protein